MWTFCFAPTLEIGAEDRSVECYYHYSVIIIIIIIIIFVIVVVVGNDTYDWVNLSSDHPLQVYYKVRHLILLQSRMVCYYNVRQVLQSATERFDHQSCVNRPNSVHGILAFPAFIWPVVCYMPGKIVNMNRYISKSYTKTKATIDRQLTEREQL